MKNSRKLALLGAVAASTFGLAACNGDSGNKEGEYANRDITYNYVIVDQKDERPDVLYEIKEYSYVGGSYSYNQLAFTTKIDNKHFVVKGDWYMFEDKPSKAFYDVEYGTKEWNDLYNTTANYSNVEENNL